MTFGNEINSFKDPALLCTRASKIRNAFGPTLCLKSGIRNYDQAYENITRTAKSFHIVVALAHLKRLKKNNILRFYSRKSVRRKRSQLSIFVTKTGWVIIYEMILSTITLTSYILIGVRQKPAFDS